MEARYEYYQHFRIDELYLQQTYDPYDTADMFSLLTIWVRKGPAGQTYNTKRNNEVMKCQQCQRQTKQSFSCNDYFFSLKRRKCDKQYIRTTNKTPQ